MHGGARGAMAATMLVLLAAVPVHASPAPAPSPALALPADLQAWARDLAATVPLPDQAGPHAAAAATALDAGTAHAESTQPTASIIGGTPAPAGTAPKGLVRLAHNGDLTGFCSGTLISPFLVLTAAHCTQVYLGDVIVIANTQVLGAGGTRYPVAGAIVDPSWNRTSLDHDAALIVLAKAYPGPVATLAAEGTSPAPGDVLNLYGWGTTASGRTPLRLARAAVHAISTADCEALNGDITAISSTMLCTHDASVGGCHGDSGGPLVDGAGTLVGIVSWGDPACDTARASVYTRVASVHALFDGLLGSTLLKVPVKPVWADLVAIALVPQDSPGDLCVVSLVFRQGACEGGMPAFVGDRVFLLLVPTDPHTTLDMVALSSHFDVVSTVGHATVALGASAISAAPMDVKPTAAIVKITPDPVFPDVAVLVGDSVCFTMAEWKVVGCDGGTDLAGLAYPYVVSLANINGLAAEGTGYVGGDYRVITSVYTTSLVFKTGMVSTAIPKLVVSSDLTILAFKPPRTGLFEVQVFRSGEAEPAATCDVLGGSGLSFCGGEVAAVAGLLGQRILVPSAWGAVDLEVARWPTAGGMTAVVEGLALIPGATMTPTLHFGPEPAAA